jgi:predicted ATPase
MEGPIEVFIRNRFVEYEFVLNNRVTVLTGDSGSGKTTLDRWVQDYSKMYCLSSIFGVEVRLSQKDCELVVSSRYHMELVKLQDMDNKIFVVDEFGGFRSDTKEFNGIIENSKAFWIIMTRETMTIRSDDLGFSIVLLMRRLLKLRLFILKSILITVILLVVVLEENHITCVLTGLKKKKKS